VLCCAVLCCAVLCCAVLCCAVSVDCVELETMWAACGFEVAIANDTSHFCSLFDQQDALLMEYSQDLIVCHFRWSLRVLAILCVMLWLTGICTDLLSTRLWLSNQLRACLCTVDRRYRHHYIDNQQSNQHSVWQAAICSC
jgi:hypothetical protein